MTEVARKYRGRAEFLFVYCRESHPADEGGWPHPRPDLAPPRQAQSVLERTETAKWFAGCLRPGRRVVVDEWSHRSLKQVYGDIDDPTVVVDVDGNVALKLLWSDAALLDTFLAKFLAGGGRVNQGLAVCVPLLRETLAIRMSVALRMWKEDHEARVTVPLLIDVLRGQEADVARPQSGANGQATLAEMTRKARQKAAATLGEIGPWAKAAVPALRKALQDEDSDLRQAAADVLWRIDPGAIPRQKPGPRELPGG